MEIKNIKERWNTTILGILRELISICERHGLHYYCCAGTAIGAVRHHGIIPWDDDIDVIMPRPDYDRLLEIAQQEDFGQYELITPYNNPAYPLYFAKLSDRTTTLVEERERPCVIGLFVDIFPLDATASDIAEARLSERTASGHPVGQDPHGSPWRRPQDLPPEGHRQCASPWPQSSPVHPRRRRVRSQAARLSHQRPAQGSPPGDALRSDLQGQRR